MPPALREREAGFLVCLHGAVPATLPCGMLMGLDGI